MSLYKIIKIVALIFVLGIVTVIVILYFSFQPKVEDLSEKEPYKAIVGTTVTTKRICYIAYNYTHFVKQNPYIIEMNPDNFFEKAKDIHLLPIGTVLIIEEASCWWCNAAVRSWERLCKRIEKKGEVRILLGRQPHL